MEIIYPFTEEHTPSMGAACVRAPDLHPCRCALAMESELDKTVNDEQREQGAVPAEFNNDRRKRAGQDG